MIHELAWLEIKPSGMDSDLEGGGDLASFGGAATKKLSGLHYYSVSITLNSHLFPCCALQEGPPTSQGYGSCGAPTRSSDGGRVSAGITAEMVAGGLPPSPSSRSSSFTGIGGGSGSFSGPSSATATVAMMEGARSAAVPVPTPTLGGETSGCPPLPRGGPVLQFLARQYQEQQQLAALLTQQQQQLQREMGATAEEEQRSQCTSIADTEKGDGTADAIRCDGVLASCGGDNLDAPLPPPLQLLPSDRTVSAAARHQAVPHHHPSWDAMMMLGGGDSSVVVTVRPTSGGGGGGQCDGGQQQQYGSEQYGLFQIQIPA